MAEPQRSEGAGRPANTDYELQLAVQEKETKLMEARFLQLLERKEDRLDRIEKDVELLKASVPGLSKSVSKFSKEQKEGVARFLDTVAASALIGGVVGLTGHSPLSSTEVIGLFLTCPILLVMSLVLRKPK